ncbi:MAG: ribosomal RNA small subunit methyltransferase I [marine bacterium B5-7]|nr:MAG: ribosomal RNA small subunit methyltransferase I [marine bacterium B5-7]
MSRIKAPAGTLYVVATPIGNFDDIGKRAIETLRSVDLIAAEDTRHTGLLLKHLAIPTSMVSLHEHNEDRKTQLLIDRIEAGDSVALVSDAGTPLISDPGYRLVKAAHGAGLRVSPLPGPCALIAGLSVAGVATDRFTFEGFLPSAGSARRRTLRSLVEERRTMVFYESPRRVLNSLADMAEIFGDNRPTAICREITKHYETIRSATLATLLEEHGKADQMARGEYVLVVGGNTLPMDETCRTEWVEAVCELRSVMPLKRAARIISGVTGVSSQLLYRLAEETGSE